MSESERVQIETSRFGTIEASAEEWIEFPGIPGFAAAKRFVLRGHDQGALFAWLVSLDVPDLAFVVTNPWEFFADYDPPVEPSQLQSLGVEAPEDLDFLVIVTLQDGQPTLNLAAPVVLNARTRKGVQVVLDRGGYSARQPLPEPKPAESESPSDSAEIPGDSAQIESKPQR